MLADERREELVRFERTFNLVRVGGAGLAFVLGPFFPNLGAWSLVLLGVGLLLEAVAIEAALRRTRTTDGAERLSRGVYFVDLIVVAFAIFRSNFYGYAVEPERIVFTVTVNFLAAFLMAGLVLELRGLRGQREAFQRQAAETEALRAV